jgi:aminoglycoside phosphotransferase (APT) family kinase protein
MTPDQRAIVEVVREAFGEPEVVEFPEVWGPRVVVGAATPVGEVFVKAAGDADVRAEVVTIGLAREAGVPVPRVLATGVDTRVPGGHWFAMSKVEGVEWAVENEVLAPRTLADIAGCLARLHRVQTGGFGPLDAAGRGTCETWPTWIVQSARCYLDALVAAGHATDAFQTMAMKVFEEATPTLGRGSLVHGDLTGCETFVDPVSGVVTGIVDWGGAIVADPVFEFAKVQAGGPADCPAPEIVLPTLLDHYICDVGIDRARIDRTLPLYRAHNAIFNADWCRREGVPWIDGLLAAADAWLRTV